jgi:hypothetical protein
MFVSRQQQLIVPVFLVLISTCPVFAQAPSDNAAPHVDVSAIASDGLASETMRSVLRLVEHYLEKAGAVVSERRDARWTLYVQPTVTGQGNQEQLVISVMTTMSMPDHIVKLGAREEVFYHDRRRRGERLPPEGTKVRQYQSGTYMDQFEHPRDHYFVTRPADEMKDACREVVRLFLEEYGPNQFNVSEKG